MHMAPSKSPKPLERFYAKVTAVEKEMERLVPRKREPYEVYGLLWDFLDRGGKRLRPLLTLTAASAVGGDEKRTLPAAAAIELFHNFTLIHDDIEDDSQLRRGKPCLHISHGIPLAVNAGDGLFMMVWQAVLDIRSPRLGDIQKALLAAFIGVLEGQAIELAWHQRNEWGIVEKDYLRMIGGKTAALIEASCRVGALMGGGDARQVEALGAYGRSIGLAFQIQDDLLNLVGEEEKYKKEIGGDIREGKRTMMVIHALGRLGAADAQRMRAILGSRAAGADEIAWCIAKLREAGSIDYAARYARQLVAEAQKQLATLPPSPARDELEAVARHVLEREV